jgi:nucleoside-diphosphate-sugar epimerase
VEALVAAGSSSEYGYKDHAPSEDEVLEPNSDYAAAKAHATHLFRLAAGRDGLPAVVLRLYSVYGPWEEPARFVPTLLEHAARGALPPLVGPDTARDFVHVDDVCEAFVRAAASAPRAAGSVFNVGSGVQTTVREAVEAARRLFGLSAEPAWGTMPRRPWDTACWVADVRRIREALGWESAIPFEEGLRRTAGWRAAPAGHPGSSE